MYYAEIPVWVVVLVFVVAWLIFKQLRQIKSSDAKQLIQSGAVVVDVRSPSEFASSSIDGVQNIPLSDLSAKISTVVPSKDTVVLCHCLSGSRSGLAVSQLKRMGYTAFNLGSFSRASKIMSNLT